MSKKQFLFITGQLYIRSHGNQLLNQYLYLVICSGLWAKKPHWGIYSCLRWASVQLWLWSTLEPEETQLLKWNRYITPCLCYLSPCLCYLSPCLCYLSIKDSRAVGPGGSDGADWKVFLNLYFWLYIRGLQRFSGQEPPNWWRDGAGTPLLYIYIYI